MKQVQGKQPSAFIDEAILSVTQWSRTYLALMIPRCLCGGDFSAAAASATAAEFTAGALDTGP